MCHISLSVGWRVLRHLGRLVRCSGIRVRCVQHSCWCVQHSHGCVQHSCWYVQHSQMCPTLHRACLTPPPGVSRRTSMSDEAYCDTLGVLFAAQGGYRLGLITRTPAQRTPPHLVVVSNTRVGVSNAPSSVSNTPECVQEDVDVRRGILRHLGRLVRCPGGL